MGHLSMSAKAAPYFKQVTGVIVTMSQFAAAEADAQPVVLE